MRIPALLLAALVAGCTTSETLSVVEKAPEPVVEGCATRSFADFPGAFTDPVNSVVGPFVLVGAAAPTSAAGALEIGGNKFPVLVREGHTALLVVPEEARGLVSLGYGPLPQGEIRYPQGHPAVDFTACTPESRRVTFWSGGVLVRKPTCAPLDVYVDGHRTPQRIRIELGVPC
jgi:hypothetical protein